MKIIFPTLFKNFQKFQVLKFCFNGWPSLCHPPFPWFLFPLLAVFWHCVHDLPSLESSFLLIFPQILQSTPPLQNNHKHWLFTLICQEFKIICLYRNCFFFLNWLKSTAPLGSDFMPLTVLLNKILFSKHIFLKREYQFLFYFLQYSIYMYCQIKY